MAKILLAEDDADLAENIRDWLTGETHLVDVVDNGDDAYAMLQMQEYDVVIIDWGLPGRTGIDVIKSLRIKGRPTPVLMLTGRKSIEEKETGLDSGADDYLVKPVAMRELSARIRALLRRPATIVTGAITIGGVTLEPSTYRVTRDGKEINLQPKEILLLKLLMEHPNQVFSAEAIIDRLWPTDSDTSPDIVRKHINKIRTKLDADGKQSIIRNIYGVGYCVEPPKK